MEIRRVQEADIETITAIYNWYILNTPITFEIEAINSEEMQRRVHSKREKFDWLVGEVNGEVIGYAYYGAYHMRAAYDHTVETSIYLAQHQTGKGFGKALYQSLIDAAKERGFREMIGIIALPNPSSIALHQRFGFEEIGRLKRVGYKFERYLDVGIWQRSLNSSGVAKREAEHH